MKKIPTLLPKDPNDLGKVINGEITVKITHYSIKIDGTSCMIKEGKPYCRYDVKLYRKKHGKIVKTLTIEEIKETLPEGAIACQAPDEKSGHYPHWIPVLETKPEHKHIWEGYTNVKNPLDGTYECIGPKIQGNPHDVDNHIWVHHQAKELIFEIPDEQQKDTPYETFKNLFKDFQWEGLVAYNGLDPVAKIRRSDFGYEKISYISPKVLFNKDKSFDYYVKSNTYEPLLPEIY
jgi:hypothetical protein